jgi:hypothetical protein
MLRDERAELDVELAASRDWWATRRDQSAEARDQAAAARDRAAEAGTRRPTAGPALRIRPGWPAGSRR